MEHFNTRRPGSGWPHSTDARQDQRITRATVDSWTAFKGIHPGSCWICCVTKDRWKPSTCSRTQITYVSGQTNLHHNTAKRGYSGVVKGSTGKWNGALLSSVMRVGSVCMRLMDVLVYGVDLVRVIFRSAFWAGQRTSTYGCCDTKCSWWHTTALASINSWSLANWTLVEHAEAGTYSFSRACHNHCHIATTVARCLEQCFAR